MCTAEFGVTTKSRSGIVSPTSAHSFSLIVCLTVPGLQWTMREPAALAMTNLIAIALALGMSRIPLFFHAVLSKGHKKDGKGEKKDPRHEISDGIHLEELGESSTSQHLASVPRAHVREEEADAEEEEEEEDKTHPRHLLSFSSIEDGLDRAIHILFKKRLEVGNNETGARKIVHQVAKNAHDEPLHFSLALIFAVVLVGLFVAEQTLAILSANIISGSEVLSASPDCGWWIMNLSALPSNPMTSSVLQYQFWSKRYLQALSYVERCYGVEDDTGSCNFLASRTIDYSVEHNAPCPFPVDVCLRGSLRMQTGLQPLSKLGLNLPVETYFRRNMTCAPLQNFINLRHLQNDTVVEYRYGWWMGPENEVNRSAEPILWSHPGEDPTVRQYEYDMQ